MQPLLKILALLKLIAESSLFTSDTNKSIEKLKEVCLLGNILVEDPDNSTWKSQHINIGILLNYYQSQPLLIEINSTDLNKY